MIVGSEVVLFASWRLEKGTIGLDGTGKSREEKGAAKHLVVVFGLTVDFFLTITSTLAFLKG